MAAGPTRHIEPLLPSSKGDGIAWQDGSVLQWQSGESIVWQSFFGPSLRFTRTTQHRAVLRNNARRSRVTNFIPAQQLVLAAAPFGKTRGARPRPTFVRRSHVTTPIRPVRPKAETLIDTLDGPTAPNPALWLEIVSGGVTANYSNVGDAYTYPVSTVGGDKATVESLGRFDLASSYIYMHFATTLATSTNSTMTLECFSETTANGFFFTVGNNATLAFYQLGGVQNAVLNVTFDPALHRWLRIREQAGTIFWDTSIDGSNWTNFTSIPNPGIAIDSMTLKFTTLGGGVNTSPGTATFIDFNTNGPYFAFARPLRRSQPKVLKTRPSTRAYVVPPQAFVDVSTPWTRPGRPRPARVTRIRHRGAETTGGAGQPADPRRRARLGLPRLRGRRADVPLAQITPPPAFPFGEFVQPRRLRGLALRRRRTDVVLDQATPIESRARRRFLGRTKTRRPIEAPVTQQQVANPDFSWPTVRESRTVRGASRRRGRGAEVVPPQVAPAAPAFVTSSPQPRRLRGMLRRGARRAEVVAAQEAVVITARKRTSRANGRRVQRSYEVIPPQQTAVDVSIMWSRDRQPRELRGFGRLRGRRTDVVQPQLNPPLPILEVVQPRRPRGLTRWRGRSFTPVRPQEAAFEAQVRFAKVSRVRRLGRRQRRPGFDTFGQAAGPTSFVKTWDGLPRAAVRTFDGVSNASTKTVDGLP